MSNTVFEINYRVGFGNLNAFFGAWWKRTWFDKTSWTRFAIYSLMVEVLMLVSTWPTLTGQAVDSLFRPGLAIDLGIVELIGALVFAFLLVFLVGPLLTYAAQMAAFAFGPMRKRLTRLHATATGVDKNTGAVESLTRWRDFTRVVETKKTVLLFTHRNSATIVPKSAFASPAEAEAFAAFARAQWEDARSVF